MEWVEMNSNNDPTTAVCTRPAHQTGFKSWILWVEVPYASSGATGEASETGLDRGHTAEMELISPSFSGDSHFLSYPLHFNCLYIHFLIFIPNNITFPIHPLVISRPTFHLNFLSFHWSNISLSPSLTSLFPVYQSPTGTFILKSLFHLSPTSALLFTPQAYVYAHTNSPSRFPFCSSNSSFQNMAQYLCHVHSVAICTCLPCMRPFCLP
jgi:hypothetical protein